MTDTSRRSFLIDSNILVYALDRSSQFFGQVNELFRWSEESFNNFKIAHQNILEVINTLVIDYKKDASLALSDVENLVAQEIFEIIYPTYRTIDIFFSFSESIHKLKRSVVFDLYLAATAMDNGVNAIITNNKKDFEGIKGFETYNLKDIENVTRSLGRKIKSEYE